jgi:hypothetical protein
VREGLPTPADSSLDESWELPAVLMPGTWATPQGTQEVSTAHFATNVLLNIPDGALLFRMGEVVGRLVGGAGERRFVALEVSDARLLIDRHIRLTATARDKETGEISVAYAPCTQDCARLVLAEAKTSSHVREVAAVVSHPVYLSGFVLAKAGYNSDAKVFYDEPSDLCGLVPQTDGAYEVLDDIVEGFCFKEEASRENAIAFIVTPIVRHAIEGNVPGHLIRAHRERTGKTLLARTLHAAVHGDEPNLIQFGSTEEEREKRITSLLLKAQTRVVIDNLPSGEEVDSPALAMLLTAPTWTGRLLGKSQTPTLPNCLTLCLTGNNVGASGEVAQRLVPSHLQAETANPQEKTDFPHPDPVAHARANRRRVLEAVLGLVEHWKAAGSKPFLKVAFGGFEAWTRAVGGILAASGCVQFLGNLREWQDSADEFTADATALLADWARETVRATGETVSPLTTARAIRERAEKLELFARFRQGTTEPSVASTFGKRVLKVLVGRITEVRFDAADGGPASLQVRMHKSTSGSNGLYSLEIVQ